MDYELLERVFFSDVAKKGLENDLGNYWRWPYLPKFGGSLGFIG